VPTSGKAPGMVTLNQYLIHRHLLHVDNPNVRSDGEINSVAGAAGLFMT
jgi:hypothetical protein